MKTIKILRTNFIYGKKFKSYYVVDYADDFVLSWGTRCHCNTIIKENYGGLAVTKYKHLSPKMKEQVDKEYINKKVKTFTRER